MKVLIVHNSYLERGGEDAVVAAEKEMLLRWGHEVCWYWRTNEEIGQYSLLRKVRFVLRDILWSKKTYDDLRRIIKEEKPDIAHFHNTFLVVSPSAYDACWDAGIPVVQTLHNYRFLCPIGVFYRGNRVCEDCLRQGMKAAVMNRCWKNSYGLTWLLVRILRYMKKNNILPRRVARFIALSEFSKQKYVQNGFPAEKFIIKPNFLDFDPGVGERRGEYVLFVGALRDYKGIITLLQSWKELEGDVGLKVIGDGPLREDVRGLADPREIEILGEKSLAQTIAYIKNALFVIVPSECYENFPRIIIEAFACGVPVLASDLGAMREHVQEGETGLMFRSQDRQDLIRKIRAMLEDKERLACMGRKARKRYEQHYTSEKNHEQLHAVYREVLGAWSANVQV
jgi:glycosyltransferase involved in cell wall biosynthesis